MAPEDTTEVATRVCCDRDITPNAPTPKTQTSMPTVVTALGCRPVRVLTIPILEFTVVRLGLRCALHASGLKVLNFTRYHHFSSPLIPVTTTKGSHHPVTSATSHCVDVDHATRHMDNARVVLTFGYDAYQNARYPRRTDGRERTWHVRMSEAGRSHGTSVRTPEMENEHCYFL